ncbi:MAG TPA: TlyA family RNA methyltransferase [Chloroflexota bacterium]|nr:TlyA family RNA methyltransferase [Chloroflexota bacterium]
MRLDVLLVERGLAPSRERARALILEGAVQVSGERHSKAGEAVAADAPVEVVGPPLPYVSRGGLKLARALEAFEVDPAGKVCLDVGASTGGFTDCLLQAGAARVYAVDVGYGQLDWKLRQDPRVVVLEKANIRNLTELPERPELATVDVSFISLTKVLEPVAALVAQEAPLIALVKPQFEAGPKAAPKGVVRDPAVHRRVLEEVLACARELGWRARGLVPSPILGPAGNREFLLWLDRTGPDVVDPAMVEQCLAS